MANDYNNLELQIVGAMQADAWLGDTANIAEIAEKLTSDYNKLYAHNFPHIGVFVTGEDPQVDIDQAYYQRTFNVLLEIACQGGYSPDVDTQLKTIAAEIVRFCNELNRDDSRLADEEIIQLAVSGVDFSANFEFENTNVYLGYINLKIIKNQT